MASFCLVNGVDVVHCGDGCVGGDGGDCDKSIQKHTCHPLKSLLSQSLQFNYWMIWSNALSVIEGGKSI